MQRDRRTLDLFHTRGPGQRAGRPRLINSNQERACRGNKGQREGARAYSRRDVGVDQSPDHRRFTWILGRLPARQPWRFPLEYLPAFEIAASTYSVSDFSPRFAAAVFLWDANHLMADARGVGGRCATMRPGRSGSLSE